MRSESSGSLTAISSLSVLELWPGFDCLHAYAQIDCALLNLRSVPKSQVVILTLASCCSSSRSVMSIAFLFVVDVPEISLR